MASSMETAVYAAILGMTEAELLDAAFLPVRRLRPRAPRMRTLIGASLLRQSPHSRLPPSSR
ncbi:hypothetical protein [Novosphingobium sp. RL4]|uniref:hypothetical protein n=1 Tax=Novosphingobium sp. RL4 TaxID=3109595 RepID=UPI002D77002F|nr:hypothetical protein [Novosphingobium sp. RL4]WRT93832.1 hypothetical protein U9J33_04755 [Novosphingobium sp. RL4]